MISLIGSSQEFQPICYYQRGQQLAHRLIKHVVPLPTQHRVERFRQLGIIEESIGSFLGVEIGSVSTLLGIKVGPLRGNVELVEIRLHQAEHVDLFVEGWLGLFVERVVDFLCSVGDLLPLAKNSFRPDIS